MGHSGFHHRIQVFLINFYDRVHLFEIYDYRVILLGNIPVVVTRRDISTFVPVGKFNDGLYILNRFRKHNSIRPPPSEETRWKRLFGIGLQDSDIFAYIVTTHNMFQLSVYMFCEWHILIPL